MAQKELPPEQRSILAEVRQQLRKWEATGNTTTLLPPNGASPVEYGLSPFLYAHSVTGTYPSDSKDGGRPPR